MGTLFLRVHNDWQSQRLLLILLYMPRQPRLDIPGVNADIARRLGVNTSCISRAIERAEKEGVN
jgi:DNA-binding MarR family transcriptional regulator